MDRDLYNQALDLFNTSEKWNAFVELANQKESIKRTYFKRVTQPLLNYFNSNPVDGWICEPWFDKELDLRWYLADFGKDSLSLATCWHFHFALHLVDKSRFDTDKIDTMLKSEYSIFMSAFDRIDEQFGTDLKVLEIRNYNFGDPHDSYFENSQLDRLAWYAGNETDKFVEQIIAKVERFRRNPQLTTMLYEIHRRSIIEPHLI
jgi:hypothetical protein